MVQAGGTNPCACDKNSGPDHDKGPCEKAECPQCYSCCLPRCGDCKKQCQENGKCKCSNACCGCPTNCLDKSASESCEGIGTGCQRCVKRCNKEKPCTCDGYVLGRCDGPCKGHVRYDQNGAVRDRNEEPIIQCDESHHGKCTAKCIKWACVEKDKNGNCIIKCTYCGKLCGQDKFRRCCYIAIPVVIIVLAFLIFRFMLPEKFHAITTKIRAAFPSSPRHPGRSLSNLVGDRIPEEMSVDRYPAFRPKAFSGLA
ncbi:hypothetical protein BBBOND_0107830 [Babesia bigemina]|uniref:Uncharacterized protein n=1 Tax=Babesia bigemina TaxID=5866 RepID=A0A061D9S4_BABBI|nr:hypothetical protein BBBOND_0107830 [Babesia bigemina]CDR94485.1 hypothetical protein BBBOND_0107830 [Babesia bigemina]|eukprot:XP_012766671.1 hypothetical protein BBBOND_0107830 [Babesia bigemina]